MRSGQVGWLTIIVASNLGPVCFGGFERGKQKQIGRRQYFHWFLFKNALVIFIDSGWAMLSSEKPDVIPAASVLRAAP